MGVVANESVKSIFANFIGTVIGIFSILFVFPLDYELYGYAQWLFGTSFLLVPILGLGIPNLFVKYFPMLHKKGLHKNGLSIMITGVFVLGTVMTVLLVLINPFLTNLWGKLGFNSQLLFENDVYLIALGFLLVLSQSLITYSSILRKIVIPDLINNVGYKIFLPLLILVFFKFQISPHYLPSLMIFFFLFVCVSLIVYLSKIHETSWNPAPAAFSIAEYKEFGKYLLFSSLNSLGTVLVFRLDVIMIGAMVGLEASGIYSLLLVMAGVMDIPSKAIGNIAGPIISSSWQQNNMANIDSIYKKSSLHLTIAGLIIFLLIWMNLPSLIQVLPGKNLGGEVVWVFVFLGLAKLVDHITSVNTQIIIYSNYYRINLYALLVLAGVNFVLNYFLIDDLGILGASIATFVSLTLFNTVKYLYIARKFDLHALSSNLMRIVGFGCVLATGIFFLPSIGNPWVDMVWQSILLVCIFTLGILRLQPSEEIQALYLQVKDKIFSCRN